MGAARVQQVIAGLPGFLPELRLRVVHALLAHHGRLEYGSPVLPMTLEALVLHNADKLDGDVRGAIDQIDRSQADQGSMTKHSPMHDTRLYRGSVG
jgi:3'-5' exoribonuclease